MLYYLFKFLGTHNIPGSRLFQYISFRASMAFILSLVIALFIGRKIIFILQKKQIGEVIRDLGLEGQMQKKGTPTMGGLIIIFSILLPVLLLADLLNIYVLILLVTMLWLGLIGFMDDYIKVFKHDKKGLAAGSKIIGQIGIGLIVGMTLFLSKDVVVRESVKLGKPVDISISRNNTVMERTVSYVHKDIKSTKTTIPFFKHHEFDYSYLIPFIKSNKERWVWLVVILAIIFIVTAVSNGANVTDGLDGLAAGQCAIIGTTLGILAYVSGNSIFANYLNIMFIPHSGEVVVFMSAFIGAMVGFLWYNSYPAQVFMGDTGSLSMGGIIAVCAIIIRKELLLPILCGIFFVESLSILMQVSYFKYTKRKYGEGRRIFKMSPLHHHYQIKGYAEPKIVTRFWIVGIMLAVITIVTLKMR
jgi:phospho-N-acetylmuramoyl-pentapeptide-transferase